MGIKRTGGWLAVDDTTLVLQEAPLGGTFVLEAGVGKIYDANAPFKFKVLAIFGYMTGAGAAGDTIKLTNGTSDICAAVDVSAKADTDFFVAAKLDDAKYQIAKDGTLEVVVASDASAKLVILCQRTE
jgi:hypothetical protein